MYDHIQKLFYFSSFFFHSIMEWFGVVGRCLAVRMYDPAQQGSVQSKQFFVPCCFSLVSKCCKNRTAKNTSSYLRLRKHLNHLRYIQKVAVLQTVYATPIGWYYQLRQTPLHATFLISSQYCHIPHACLQGILKSYQQPQLSAKSVI